MCEECYDTWPERAEFCNLYVDHRRANLIGSGEVEVFSDGDCLVILCVGRIGGEWNDIRMFQEPLPKVKVWLRATATELVAQLADWPNLTRTSSHREARPIETEAIKKALSEIAGKVPDPSRYLAEIDVPTVLKDREEWLRNNSEKPVWLSLPQKPIPPNPVVVAARSERRERNLKFHKLYEGKPDCPYCGADHSSLKYYDNRENHDRRSCVICQVCARSSGVEELEDTCDLPVGL